MQNKHQKIFDGGVPTSGEGEGGGQVGWDKIPTFTDFFKAPL